MSQKQTSFLVDQEEILLLTRITQCLVARLLCKRNMLQLASNHFLALAGRLQNKQTNAVDSKVQRPVCKGRIWSFGGIGIYAYPPVGLACHSCFEKDKMRRANRLVLVLLARSRSCLIVAAFLGGFNVVV